MPVMEEDQDPVLAALKRREMIDEDLKARRGQAQFGAAISGLGDVFAAGGSGAKGFERQAMADFDARAKSERDALDTGVNRQKLVADYLVTKKERTQKEGEDKEENDPVSLTSKLYQENASKMSPGRDFSTFSAKQLKAALPGLEKIYESDLKTKKETADRENDLAKERIKLEGDQKKTEIEKAGKELDQAKSRKMPGYTTSGDVEIDDVTARNLRNGVAEYVTFKSDLQQYKDLIKKHGTTEILDGGVAAEMNALSKSLQLKIKNLAQLGVLSASDIPFIEEQIPMPGAWKRVSGMLGALESTERSAQKSHLNQMRVNGYLPEVVQKSAAGGDDKSQRRETRRKRIVELQEKLKEQNATDA